MKPQYRQGFFIPDRLEENELLDIGVGSSADVAVNLREMERINHWLGGTRSLTMHLFPLLDATQGRVTVVDAGTGGGGLLRQIRRWARAKTREVVLIGVDYSARVLQVASQRRTDSGAVLVQSDARCLPVRADGSDFVTSSLLLHHFSPNQVVTFLSECYRVAQKGVVMNDLVRGWMPYAAFKLVQPVFASNYLTRLDGATSIRRAYLPAELLALARAAGLATAQVVEHFPWRMTLVALK